MSENFKKATLGAGCFWCTEAVFSKIKGVVNVVSGYSGGETTNPTYEAICTGTTGHAEVIQITYNENLISFEELLVIFWTMHDPTTLNRQGADVGTQYRSVVYYHDDDQYKIALAYKNGLDESGVFPDPVVTEITQLDIFYEAEKYHQHYYRNHLQQAYCQFVILPKIEKIKKYFSGKWGE